MILPNVDATSLSQMLQTEKKYSGFCYAAVGLHPTSVKADYIEELKNIETLLEQRKWIAIGEIGLDFYWDKTFATAQIKVFRQQLEWALSYHMPVIIHIRNAMSETLDILEEYQGKGLTGVLHCFSGTPEEAARSLSIGGFKLGIGGVLTFKNSRLSETLQQVPLSEIVLETDSPYLAPVPHRGSRNESAYLPLVVEKLAQIYDYPAKTVMNITTRNAESLFFENK